MERSLQEPLDALDYELIEAARAAIRPNYDPVNFDHTVGAAVRCKDGSIYTGVNLYTIHGACGEFIALGAAITAGRREFEAIVAVEGEQGENIRPPCGNCRQMLSHYAPGCKVILPGAGGPFKIPAAELLPFAYEIEP